MCLRPPETCKQGCHLERRSSTCTWDRQSQPEISVSKSDRGRLPSGGFKLEIEKSGHPVRPIATRTSAAEPEAAYPAGRPTKLIE